MGNKTSCVGWNAGEPADQCDHEGYRHATSVAEIRAALKACPGDVSDVDGDTIISIRKRRDGQFTVKYTPDEENFVGSYVVDETATNHGDNEGLGYVLVPDLMPASEEDLATAVKSLQKTFAELFE